MPPTCLVLFVSNALDNPISLHKNGGMDNNDTPIKKQNKRYQWIICEGEMM